MAKYDVDVQLTGQDGNAFAIIGAVSRAIRKVAGPEAADEWCKEAMSSESYDALLNLCCETVNVH